LGHVEHQGDEEQHSSDDGEHGGLLGQPLFNVRIKSHSSHAEAKNSALVAVFELGESGFLPPLRAGLGAGVE
jgi:hypothetical protein